MNNLLIHSENINALKYLRDDLGLKEKVSLVYIDPPFATGRDFTVDFDGRISTISRSGKGKMAYADTLTGNAYLMFLRDRLEIIYDLLSASGSLYLHIDYKVGHYVKVLLDSIFGGENFRNDITRIKCNPKNFSRIGYGNIKDMILFYTKSSKPTWNEPMVPMTEEDIVKLYPKTDKYGRHYTTIPLHAPGETVRGKSAEAFKGIYPPPGRHWRCSVTELEELDKKGLIEWSAKGNPRKINYADEHTTRRLQDIWTFKDPIFPQYPTEKNLEMLKTIINTSSNEGDIVLDCFAGSGTTLLAASQLNRKWIGVDASDVAIATIKQKLQKGQSLYTNIIYDIVEL